MFCNHSPNSPCFLQAHLLRCNYVHQQIQRRPPTGFFDVWSSHEQLQRKVIPSKILGTRYRYTFCNLSLLSLIFREVAILQFYFESFDYEEAMIFEEGFDIFLCKYILPSPR